MGREDHRAVIGAIRRFLDKRALRTQGIDDEFVMSRSMADIDRRAPFPQRHLDDLDRAVNPAQNPRGAAR